MPELLGFKYHFENGSSDITLVSLASSRPNLMDSKYNVPKQIQPLERLKRIKQSSRKDLKMLTFLAPFPLYDSPTGINKEILSTKLNSIDRFIDEVAIRLGINSNKMVIVLMGESCSYGPFLYFHNTSKYRNIVIINPYFEFYKDFISIISNPYGYKKYFPIFNVDANLNDPKIFKKQKFLSKLNLFVYSQGDRYALSKFIDPAIKNIQNKIIELLDMSGPIHLARSFYIHFKKEEKPKDYKTNINLFINKYFFSPQEKVERDPELRKNLPYFDPRLIKAA